MDYESKREYIKAVMLGESSKIVPYSNFQNKILSSDQKSTVNAYYLEKTVQIDNHGSFKIAIWDTAGQEEFNAMMPMYYRGAEGAILVYDIAYRDTFERVHKWIKELKSFGSPDIVLAIVGNKCDLENMRQVSQEKAEKYANQVGALHFQGSAKSGKGVQEIFKAIIKEICERRAKKLGKKSQSERVNLKLKKETANGCCGGD